MSLAWGGQQCVGRTTVCGEDPQCSGHTGFAPARGMCFPRLHCSGSRLLYRERALSWVRFQFSGTPQKRRLGWTCVLCLPRPSSSGHQELDGCPLPGCSAPSPLCCPSLSFRVYLLGSPCVCSGELVSSCDPPSRCQPSRVSGGIWLETGNLFAIW